MPDPALRTTDPAQLIAARQKVVEAQQLRDGAGTDLVKLRAATDLLIEAADAFALATVPVEHGTLHLDLADTLSIRARLGDPDVLDEAVDSYQKAIVVFNRDEFPEAYTRAFSGLGLASWTGGQLEMARWCFEQVASALSTASESIEYAKARGNVAAVLAAMPDASARNQALSIYTDILKSVPADTHPIEHAEFLLSLGQAHRVQMVESRLEPIRNAIAAFEPAAQLAASAGRNDLAVRGLVETAITYVELSILDPATFDAAVIAFDRALEAVPATTQPDQHAELQLEYGRLWANQVAQNHASAYTSALQHYEAAIALGPSVISPSQMAPALIDAPLLVVERDAPTQDELDRAIELSRLGLSAWPRAQFPAEYARVQQTLGGALLKVEQDRATNVAAAVEALEAGLDAVNREEQLITYAGLQATLAEALLARRDGDRADHHRRAGIAAERALEAETKDARTIGVARHVLAQISLAQGGAPQLATAINHLQQAVSVRPRATRPTEHGETQMLLGIALASQAANGGPATLTEAVEAYRVAVDTIDQDKQPMTFASAHNNLAAALVQLAGPSGTSLLQEAIQSYDKAVGVFTETTFPQQHAIIQRSLEGAQTKLEAMS
jgi:tetratricopeptide (TPR) repeat protein